MYRCLGIRYGFDILYLCTGYYLYRGIVATGSDIRVPRLREDQCLVRRSMFSYDASYSLYHTSTRQSYSLNGTGTIIATDTDFV